MIFKETELQFILYKFELPNSFPSSPILSRKKSNNVSVPDNKMKVQRSIIVHDILSTIEEDTLRMFFENEARSGGGDIESIDLNRSLCKAYITFCNEKGMLKMLSL